MAKRIKNSPRRGATRQLLGLLGVGSAALLTGLYVVGRKEQQRSNRQAERDTGTKRAEPRAEPNVREIAGPSGGLEILEVGQSTARLPVLFVHGLGGNAHHGSALLDQLGTRRKAVALSLRGHGASQAGEDYSIPALAGDVRAALDGARLDRCLLVGHDLGAAVAAAFAADHPQRVAALVLLDPNGEQSRLPQEQIRQFLDPVENDPHGELRFQFRQLLAGSAPETAETILQALAATPAKALIGPLRSAAVHSTTEDLERYPGPALSVVTPLNSLPISLHRLLPQRLPGTTLLDSSHWLMLDRPREVAAILERFLKDIEHG